MSWKRPSYSAKDALTRFQVSYSTTTTKVDRVDGHVQFQGVRYLNQAINSEEAEYIKRRIQFNKIRVNKEHIQFNKIRVNKEHIQFKKIRLNRDRVRFEKSRYTRSVEPRSPCLEFGNTYTTLVLAKTLDNCQKLHEEIAAALTYPVKHPHAASGSNKGPLESLIRAKRWIPRLEEHIRELMASQRHCLVLRATQLLLDVIWSLPPATTQEGLSQSIIDFANAAISKASMKWAKRRRSIILYINYVQRHASQLELSSQQLPAPELEPCLNRALMLVLAVDRLSIAMRLRGALQILVKLIDEMVRVVKRLELMNERVQLTARLHPFMPVYRRDRNVADSKAARY
ncbi:hypothetical protein F4801DRAFT_440546 [Xylaria longipes]|nr:hypothetical protein F4801DRAFT_440546 [Xylaria longipes]